MMHPLEILPTVVGVTLALGAGGLIKGIISIGLPLISLPLLLMAVDIKSAIALLMVPMLVSNLMQAIEGEGTLAMLRRFTPLLLAMAVGTMIGTALFAALSPQTLELTIGPLAILFSTASYLHPNLTIPARSEGWLGTLIGFVSGVIGGMSTFFGPVLAAYVVGLRLGRDAFVKGISLIYVFASGYLVAGGLMHGFATPMLLVWSAVGMVPVYLGMRLGALVRYRIDAEKFRVLVLAVVWLTGANMVRLGLGY
jgi:uncharacterized membrane protein YfcA